MSKQIEFIGTLVLEKIHKILLIGITPKKMKLENQQLILTTLLKKKWKFCGKIS